MDYRRTLQPDTILDGKYRIERVIGSGGFGITYEAYDLRLAASVAIKEYFPSQFGLRDATFSVRPRSDGDREMFERLRSSFLREARTLNQFDHPAIVRVLSVFESHGTAYMVMKYETGPNLKAWLADLGRLPTQNELDRLTVPLLDALEMMHAAEFLHRDIAPDNIIVRADGTPVLLDFGASRRVMGEVTGTLTGVVKKGYSPQEQYATDGRSQGPWTDVYALGATLYRCVSNETPDEATNRMLEDKLLPAAEIGAGHYRPAFLTAIDAAMILRPSGRPQSIAAWRGMLFDGVAVPSGNPQSWPTVAGTEPASGGAASAAAIASRPSRSGWREAALAAGLVALIGGGALLAGWDPASLGGTPPPRTPQDVSVAAKTDDTWRREAEEEKRRPDDGRPPRLSEEEMAARQADQARERAAAAARWAQEEARRVAEEERRAAAEEEVRKRLLAEAAQARRQAEEAQRRATEERQQQAAEVARQRKIAEDAETSRLAAEEAQRRQEEEIKRLTREAAERAAEETRRKIEQEAHQRKLAEESEARRLAAEEAQRRQEEEIKRLTREAAERASEQTRRKIEEEARQRKLAEDAAAARKAEETQSRAAADERAKEAKERTKIAALPKLPNPSPPRYAFDGRWVINTTALSPQCRLSSNQFPILIANHQISTRGGGSGEISGSGSVRWTGRSRFGPRPVDWTGTFRGNSGSGSYNARGGKCHGRFVARRG